MSRIIMCASRCSLFKRKWRSPLEDSTRNIPSSAPVSTENKVLRLTTYILRRTFGACFILLSFPKTIEGTSLAYFSLRNVVPSPLFGQFWIKMSERGFSLQRKNEGQIEWERVRFFCCALCAPTTYAYNAFGCRRLCLCSVVVVLGI